jgi:hypothetical protein
MRKLLVIIALLGASGPLCGGSLPSAVAAGVSPPVADCSAHGTLSQHYTASELRNALATMPTDVQEYTNCPDVIRRALLAELGAVSGPGGGGGGSGGSFLPGWVIAVLVVLVLAGAAAGAMAFRNRRQET